MLAVLPRCLLFGMDLHGMNFNVLPEKEWEYGYAYFWGLVLLIVAGLLVVMRKNKLL